MEILKAALVIVVGLLILGVIGAGIALLFGPWGIMEILKTIFIVVGLLILGVIGAGIVLLCACGGEETPPDEPDYWKKMRE